MSANDNARNIPNNDGDSSSSRGFQATRKNYTRDTPSSRFYILPHDSYDQTPVVVYCRHTAQHCLIIYCCARILVQRALKQPHSTSTNPTSLYAHHQTVGTCPPPQLYDAQHPERKAQHTERKADCIVLFSNTAIIPLCLFRTNSPRRKPTTLRNTPSSTSPSHFTAANRSKLPFPPPAPFVSSPATHR